MKPVTIHDISIGSGRPKIAVPIMASTPVSMDTEMLELEGRPFDVLEIRLDALSSEDMLPILRILEEAQGIFPDKIRLVTFRTEQEGGLRAISPAYYAQIIHKICHDARNADIIDIEESMLTDLDGLVEFVHDHGIRVLLSHHNFERTMPKDAIVHRLRRMEEEGADIAKIALMPQSEDDVQTLMDACKEASQSLSIPVVCIAMGELGQKSRTQAEAIGSAITFAAGFQASAPGQITLEEMDEILQAEHDKLQKTQTAGV